jgi:Immunity protein 22
MSIRIPTHKTDESKVSIWVDVVGRDGTDPFAEQYDDEAAPLSPFAGAFQIWYDHDYLEVTSRDEPLPLAELLQDISYEASFRAEFLAAAEKIQVSEAFGIVCLFEIRYTPSTAKTEALGFQFLGSFSFSRD